MPKAEVVAAGFFLRQWQPKGWRWLLLKATRHGEWGFPKGRSEPGERLLETARRECREESGLSVVHIEGRPYRIVYRTDKGRRKVAYYFPARTGQQRIGLSHEHSVAAWLDAESVLRRLRHPSLRTLFKRYLRNLEASERSWPSN